MERRTFLTHGVAGVVGTGAGFTLARQTDLGPWSTARIEEERGLAATDDVGDIGSSTIVWSGSVELPYATLTFDDGPDPEFTPRVLDALAAAGVTATFNMMGWNVAEHETLARAVLAAGHEIGNHTFTHKALSHETPETTKLELERGLTELTELSGGPVRWFRPPRGQLTGIATQYAASMGHDILMWSTRAGGRGKEDPNQIERELRERIQPGRIVALHDGVGRGTFHRDRGWAKRLVRQRNAEVTALPRALEDAAERGITLVTAGELVALATPPGGTG